MGLQLRRRTLGQGTETAQSEELQDHNRTAKRRWQCGSALMLCLFGCATQKVTTYSYCLVDDVKKDVIDDLSRWIVHCDGGGTVIFPRQVGIGEGVYFSPYYE